jgi:D-alanyl-D-alanine carboxypeptidase
VTRSIATQYRTVWDRLGIPESLIAERNLPIFELATELQLAEVSAGGVEHRLTPVAAAAWKELKAAAYRDDVDIYVVSAFRSVERQAELIARKLGAGQSLHATLKILAPPGCSEHHTGRAVDLGSGRFRPLQSDFDASPAFAWLSAHAGRFGFSLSFPKDNAFGFVYEPWHWCFSEAGIP